MTISISTLSNGLRVITDSNDRVDSAALGLWVNVGSRHEELSKNGIAHFLEHMAFKGTQTRSAKEIAESIENVGGYLNASTGRETTAYYARVLKEDIDLAMDILADIIQNSIFDEKEIEREREVILQEIHQCNDTPDDIIFDHFQKASFENQAIGRSILGPEKTVRKLNRDDLLNFVQKNYAASRMVLSAAGNISHSHIVALAEEKFSSLASDTTILSSEAQYTGGLHLEKRSLEQIHLILGYNGLSLNDPDYYTASVLATLLGGGMSSQLFQEVREKRGLAYSICAFKSCFSDGGVFGIYAATSPHQADELIDVTRSEIQNLEKTLNEEKLTRARNQLKAGLLMSLESVPTRCEQLAQHMIFFGRPVSRAEIIDRIEAVTQEGLIRLANTIFSSSPTFVALGDIKKLRSAPHLFEGTKNKLSA